MLHANRNPAIAGDAPAGSTSRLQAELQRLYPSPQPGRDDTVRAVLLELARPANWVELAKVWQGVQADLGLPAPAIAVSGSDGYQLWFSLAQAVAASQAALFVEGLRQRYLADIEPRRVSMPRGRVPPPVEVTPGHWSAFVTPDLAGLFADEPWLDLSPSADAQADLLSRIESTKPDDWKRALEQLRPAAAAAAAPAPAAHEATETAPAAGLHPKQFLLDVMNDPAVDLHLRIEAAKALLPHIDSQGDA
jgi:hypothetical protein